MFFLILGAVNASELDNATNSDDSNLLMNKLSSADMQESSLESVADDNVLNNANVQANGASSTNTTKTSTKLTVNSAHYSKSNTIFKIDLADKDGNLLNNKTVTLKLNGKTYSATTDINGSAYVKVPSQKIGTYSVTAKFNGDSKYSKSSFSGKVKVLSSITNRANIVKTYGVEKNFTATFWKDNERLSNTTVKIIINGKTYSVKTNSKGVAQIGTDLVPGKYTIKSYNPYSKETTSNTLTINKDSSKIVAYNEYIPPKTKYTYSITLKSGQNTPISNAKIQFTFNYKKTTASTDKNGKANLAIPALSKGTYKISYSYAGNSKYKSVSGSKTLYVQDSTTKLTANNLKMQYNDGSMFSVKATDTSGKALVNKTITFTLNGKTTTSKTDSAGIAKLAVGDLNPGTYTVKSVYSKLGSKDYKTLTNSITISKQKLNINTADTVVKYNSGSSFQAIIKNQTGAGIKDITVIFTLNGKTSNVTTDANGIAKLVIREPMGSYPITTQIVDTSLYTAQKVTNNILVNGTKFRASDMTLPADTPATFSVTLLDTLNNPVRATVKFTLNNNVKSVQTDANGIANLPISGLKKGTYKVTYTDGSTSGTSTITVTDKVTLQEVIKASQNVKSYIEGNGELPNTVTIGGVTYNTASYLYMASQAIINLKNNNKGDIVVKSVNNPANPQAAANLGNLYDYLSVAKSIVSTANSKGMMPDSVSSAVGNIGYNGLVYAIARVVAFYGDNSAMPNYVVIKTYSKPSYDSPLNTKNTITDLKPYLAASTNCQVNDPAIVSLVKSLTSGLTTDFAKATAIYNYVRDAINYNFYYNTLHGAVGTLNVKNGNCVDQSHLLVAMYRTAGLPARYAHGTCTFSSGTYGHVWTQVLIGDTWIVGDPTSSRNSLGNVANWNNNNYQFKGFFQSIAF